MDENDEVISSTPLSDTAPPEVPTAGRESLHRSATRRVFGGVCGGLGDRFDVDANIVRVVFVVLSVLYGLGVVVYLAMWVLIPRATSADAVDGATAVDEPVTRNRWLKFATPLSVVVLIVIFIAAEGHTHRWSSGISLGGLRFDKGLIALWLIFLLFLAVISLRSPHRAFSFGRFLAWVVLSVMSFFILFVGALLITVQVIGVPLEGGSGVKVWTPTSLAQVQRSYHGAIGSSTIDLSKVPFGAGTRSITATQGVGKLTVEVPRGVIVGLRTHVGIGSVQLACAPWLNAAPVKHSGSSHLNLNLQAGVGQIQIDSLANCRP